MFANRKNVCKITRMTNLLDPLQNFQVEIKLDILFYFIQENSNTSTLHGAKNLLKESISTFPPKSNP